MPPLAHSPGRNQCAPIFRFGNGIIVQFAVPVKRHATRFNSRKVAGERPGGGFCLETQCAAAFVYQFLGGADAECGAGGTGGGEFATGGVLELPGVGATGGRDEVVWHRAGRRGKGDFHVGGGGGVMNC